MINLPKVSVVIPSYNRFDYLLEALESVRAQNYSNLEVFVINDGSTQEEYYSHKFDSDIELIHLKENQKNIHGFGPGAIRNFGTNKATGKFLAFLDDDDIWMPEKLEIQLEAMKESGSKFSSTEGFYGEGVFKKEINYQLYNSEKYLSVISKKYSRTKFSSSFLERIKGKSFIYPDIWTYDFLKIHNCVITSSVVVEKSLMNALGGFRGLPTSLHADYDCWLGLLKLTNLLYINEPLFYYDGNHGIGQNWK